MTCGMLDRFTNWGLIWSAIRELNSHEFASTSPAIRLIGIWSSLVRTSFASCDSGNGDLCICTAWSGSDIIAATFYELEFGIWVCSLTACPSSLLLLCFSSGCLCFHCVPLLAHWHGLSGILPVMQAHQQGYLICAQCSYDHADYPDLSTSDLQIWWTCQWGDCLIYQSVGGYVVTVAFWGAYCYNYTQ